METFGKSFISEIAKALSEITREEIDKMQPAVEIPKDTTFDRIYEATDEIKRLCILCSKVLAKTKHADSPSNFECLCGDELFVKKLVILSVEKMLYSTYFQKVKSVKFFKDWKMGIVFDKEKELTS